MKKWLSSAPFRVLVSALLIIILLYIMRDRYGQIVSALKGTDIALFWIGMLVFIGALAAASLRLKIIVQAEENFRNPAWAFCSLG